MARDHGRPLYVITSGGNQRRAQNPAKTVARRIRSLVLERDEFRCQTCGLTAPADEIAAFRKHGHMPSTLHLDHIFPYHAGGQFTEQNLQVLCVRCNGTKGGRH